MGGRGFLEEKGGGDTGVKNAHRDQKTSRGKEGKRPWPIDLKKSHNAGKEFPGGG